MWEKWLGTSKIEYAYKLGYPCSIFNFKRQIQEKPLKLLSIVETILFFVKDRIKIWLCSTMTQRQKGLLLSIHYGMDVDCQVIVDSFSRRQLEECNWQIFLTVMTNYIVFLYHVIDFTVPCLKGCVYG